MIKEPLITFESDIRRCARCGGSHRRLEFVAFEIPFTDTCGVKYPFWAECPITGDPVLMHIVDKRRKA